MTSSHDPNEKLAELLLSLKGQYHNHKETMAHASILLQIGLAAWIISMKHWPPKWIPAIKISETWVAFTGFTIFWLLIHVYMWWQLKKRENAAKHVDSLLMALLKTSENSQEPVKTEKENDTNTLYQLIKETQLNKAEGSLFSKWLLYIGSVSILIIVLLRTILGK